MIGHSPGRRLLFRSALGGLAGLAFLGGAWWWRGQRAGRRSQTSGLGRDVDRLLAEMHGVGQVGAWAATENPALDLPMPELVGRLRERLRLGKTDHPTGEYFSRALKAAVTEDYRREHVLLVNQWQLSHTEVLLAILRWKTVGITTTGEPGPGPAEAPVATIGNWGPRQTFVGEPANQQDDGSSALWFVSNDAPDWTVLAIGGTRVPTTHREGIIVAQIDGTFLDLLLAETGDHWVTLHDDMAHTWQRIGLFRVLPAPTDRMASGFCTLSGWGPRQTGSGVAANRQPDGSMGLWISTGCAPARVQVRFGDERLDGHFDGHAVTARVGTPLLRNPGRIAVMLINAETGEELLVGEFVVTP